MLIMAISLNNHYRKICKNVLTMTFSIALHKTQLLSLSFNSY